jgi:hypothetical protein
MNKIALMGGAALALVASPLLAQTAKPAAPRTLTEEQKAHGIETFRLIASGMQSQNVPDDVKSVLMGCIYENPIGKISDAVDQIVAANPDKVDRTKPEQMLGVIASVCGYEPKDVAPAPATGKTPAPAPSGTPKGR